MSIFARDLNGEHKDITQNLSTGAIKLNRVKHLNIGQPGRAIEWYDKYASESGMPIIRCFLLRLEEIDRIFEEARPVDQLSAAGQFELKRGMRLNIVDGSLVSVCEEALFVSKFDGVFLNIDKFLDWFFEKKRGIEEPIIKKSNIFSIKYATEILSVVSYRKGVKGYLYSKVCSKENFMDLPIVRAIAYKETMRGRYMAELLSKNIYVKIKKYKVIIINFDLDFRIG